MKVAGSSTRPLFVLFAAATILGCSNHQMYEGFQASQRAECLSVPPEKYDGCMEAANISFETYRMQREEAKQ